MNINNIIISGENCNTQDSMDRIGLYDYFV